MQPAVGNQNTVLTVTNLRQEVTKNAVFFQCPLRHCYRLRYARLELIKYLLFVQK